MRLGPCRTPPSGRRARLDPDRGLLRCPPAVASWGPGAVRGITADDRTQHRHLDRPPQPGRTVGAATVDGRTPTQVCWRVCARWSPRNPRRSRSPTRSAELTFAQLATEAACVRRSVLEAARGAGIGSADPVGLLHPHETGAVAALFGVLASGHPVVVLDPRTPPSRLAMFVERSGAKALVIGPDTALAGGEIAESASVDVALVLPDLDAGARAEELWSAADRPGRAGCAGLHLRLDRAAEGRGQRPPAAGP